jgi:SAM-dependent methyltransferase
MTKKTKNSAAKKENSTLTIVKEHYEDYPYPYRDPELEKERLLCMQGEYLGQLNHWLFKGKEDFNSGFRVLVAGGGTGDSIIYMAEQLKNKNASLVYLDFSKASMQIAQRRAEIRGLKNITWVNDSILNIPNLNLGKFDYINCVGVLHHLKDPDEGLMCLKESLSAKGGIGLMLYAKYGRTGVYHVQELMNMVNEGIDSRAQEIMNGKIIIDNLPSTNWYVRGQELLADHKLFGDVGLYDMFLHKQDRAYSIPEMYEFVEKAGLNFVEFTSIISRINLRLENHVKDFTLLSKLRQKDLKTQQAMAEIIIGNIIKHEFYVSAQKDSQASFDELDNVPYFYTINDMAKQLYEYLNNNLVAVGTNLSFTVNNSWLKNVNVSIPISELTKHIFKGLK